MSKLQRSFRLALPLILLFPVLLWAQSPSDTLSESKTTPELIVPDGMRLIPGGTAMIGSDWDEMEELVRIGKKVPHMSIGHARWWYGDETPRHAVEIEPFFMDVSEVTNAEFRKFVEETHYSSEGDWYKYASVAREDHPVLNVTYNDAVAYAKWAGKRLPTEQEWEWAAMGGSDARWYPWGDTITAEDAQWRSQGESFFAGVIRLFGLRKLNTRPVGSFAPNGYGLYDMVGNVCEWTASPYTLYSGFVADPNGAENGAEGLTAAEAMAKRIVRGGSWESSNPVFLRVPNRHGYPMDNSRWTLGFRCVRDIES